MDIIFDPPGSGLFTEVYLYEELMEADLHAIVSFCRDSDHIQRAYDIRSALVNLSPMHTSNPSSTKPSVVSR